MKQISQVRIFSDVSLSDLQNNINSFLNTLNSDPAKGYSVTVGPIAYNSTTYAIAITYIYFLVDLPEIV